MFDRLFAEGGDLGPILIYLVIFVVWAIGKALTGIKRNQSQTPEKPRPARPAKGGRTLDPTLKEFLETLTGQTIETEPAPTPAAPPPVQPVARPPRRPPPAIPTPAPTPTPLPRVEIDLEAMAEEDMYRTPDVPVNLIEITEIGDHEHFQKQALGSLSALAGMEALRIPMSSMRLPIKREDRAQRNPVHLRQTSAARQAIIQRIVLGPPRCMQPDPEDQQVLVG